MKISSEKEKTLHTHTQQTLPSKWLQCHGIIAILTSHWWTANWTTWMLHDIPIYSHLASRISHRKKNNEANKNCTNQRHLQRNERQEIWKSWNTKNRFTQYLSHIESCVCVCVCMWLWSLLSIICVPRLWLSHVYCTQCTLHRMYKAICILRELRTSHRN